MDVAREVGASQQERTTAERRHADSPPSNDCFYRRIDEKEAEWNRNELPVQPVLPKHVFPSPYVDHPLAHLAFLRLVDVLDPPDEVEKNNGRPLPCWVGGALEGGTFTHLLFECESRRVREVRELHLAQLEYTRMELFVNAWCNQSGRKSLGHKKRKQEELLSRAQTYPREVNLTLLLLKSMYRVRQEARYEGLKKLNECGAEAVREARESRRRHVPDSEPKEDVDLTSPCNTAL